MRENCDDITALPSQHTTIICGIAAIRLLVGTAIIAGGSAKPISFERG